MQFKWKIEQKKGTQFPGWNINFAHYSTTASIFYTQKEHD